MIWKRTLLMTTLLLTGLLLETSVLGEATLVGAKPPILLLFTVALALGEGPAMAAGFGFAGGLLTDLMTGLPTGITALAYTIVGYAVGTIRAQLQTPSAWLPVTMEFAASLGGLLLYGGVALLLGQEAVGGRTLLITAVFGACYNALLTPFMYPLVRALAARLRPARVLR
ncbi:MAG: rod shape-determining protein MreD [Actinomycetota bacterium]